MAAIDELLRQIPDEALRRRLAQEFETQAKQKKFGLVWEDHVPECTMLPDVRIKRGSLVAKRDGEISDLYRVKTLGDGIATCQHEADGTEVTIAVSELVAVARFGEPIFPYLKPQDSICRAPESDLWHTLIEADNFHALQLLAYLYAGQVDCIYIDPPYNTGARDWKYNNDYVDSSDQYRHSKWLSMMEKRLRLAKKLLNPKDSVLIVTIDEKEYNHLGCLLEELFPEANTTMVTDVINPRAGVARLNSFSRTHEFIYFLQLGTSSVCAEQKESKKSPIWFSLMRTGSNSSRQERPNLFYPVWVEPNGNLIKVGDNIELMANRDSIAPPCKEALAIWPLRPDGRENCWQLGRETLSKAFKEGTAKVTSNHDKFTINYLRNAEKERMINGEIICIGRDDAGALILKHNDAIKKTKSPEAVWLKGTHDAGIYGTSLIGNIFKDRRFSFPKSLYAVHDTLRFFVANKPNALIVDFFAGSGTTLHAVNLLNKEDGGHRRCIMVTNNEVSEDEANSLKAQGHKPGDEEWERLGIARYVT